MSRIYLYRMTVTQTIEIPVEAANRREADDQVDYYYGVMPTNILEETHSDLAYVETLTSAAAGAYTQAQERRRAEYYRLKSGGWLDKP